MKPKHLIYATCFVTLLYIAPSVCISSMVASFGQARQAAVLSLLTLPSLTSIAGLFLAPVLAKRASLRALNLAALALLTATGLASFACAGSLEVLLALSAVMGVAYGLLNTLFPLLAAAYYQGDELGRVMGVASGMLQLGRVAAMLAGGALAGLGWRYVYLLFLMALAPLAMSFALRRPAPPSGGQPASQGRGLYWGRLLGLGAAGFSFTAVYYISSTHASLYIEGYGLGTAAATGALSALACGLSGLLSLGYSFLRRYTGRFTFALAFLIVAAGYLPAALSPSLGAAGLAICASLAGMALFYPELMLHITHSAAPGSLPWASALVLACNGLGYTAAPALNGWLAGFLPVGGAAGVFLAAGLVALAAALALAAASRRLRI